ncbi:hypothetical protein PIB30_042806 [Stylosanthes scabra]|uniref:Uncharacterized protein n=1 Tax=Stylosanthes scabra TaxID=79078 RepID=A0ABU6SGM7_9FABA|nr:hypothetical protein [Stylosanthes scabra]
MYILAQKLKLCRYRLVQWQQSSNSNAKKEIDDILRQLEELREVGESGGIQIDGLERKLELAYSNESGIEERNHVSNGLRKVAEDYFRGIFSSSDTIDPTIAFEDFSPRVTSAMNRKLLRPVTIKESLVAEDVFKVVRSIFVGGRILRAFNHTHICLIPKISDAKDMSQEVVITISYSVAVEANLLVFFDQIESGQQVNLNKSFIFFSSNIPIVSRVSIVEKLNIRHIRAQDKYLGLPSTVNRSKKATFAAIKEKVTQRAQG